MKISHLRWYVFIMVVIIGCLLTIQHGSSLLVFATTQEVVLHFAENFYSAEGQRIFDIRMQNQTAFQNVDIMKLTNGQQYEAVTLESTQIVSDGILTIEFVKLGSSSGDPKLCGIEINIIGPHLAHAVVGGPYTAVAPSNSDGSDGVATVSVDGHASHTHGPGLRLVEWIWKVNNEVVGTEEETEILLPPGIHTLTLFVKDDDGNESAESTSVTVLTSEYPAVQSISPASGNVGGGDFITIQGSGFTFAASATVVHFGDISLSSTDISIVDSNTITLSSPITTVATTYYVAVSTPLGKSNALGFTYIDKSPIAFTEKKVIDIYSPTTVAFGPGECRTVVNLGREWRVTAFSWRHLLAESSLLSWYADCFMLSPL